MMSFFGLLLFLFLIHVDSLFINNRKIDMSSSLSKSSNPIYLYFSLKPVNFSRAQTPLSGSGICERICLLKNLLWRQNDSRWQTRNYRNTWFSETKFRYLSNVMQFKITCQHNIVRWICFFKNVKKNKHYNFRHMVFIHESFIQNSSRRIFSN